MPKKSLEQKLADLEREEESKVKRRRQRKYDERLEKGKQKAERKADEVERKVRLTYKKKREKIKRVARGLSSVTPSQQKKREKRKLLKETSDFFSKSVRISTATYSTQSFASGSGGFFASCYTCEDVKMVCYREKDKKDWKRCGDMQNGHQIAQGRGNGLKFYRPVCRVQCAKCNVRNAKDQAKREKKRKEEVGQKEYDKAKHAKKRPKSFTIEELEKILQESKKIINDKLKKAKHTTE